MSEAEIERLVADRSLVRELFRDEQIASLWAKAVASYGDAALPGLSAEGAFQSLYTAVLQASIATLAAHGLRVKSTANHYRTFYALRNLHDALDPHGSAFDEMRATRNDSVYELTHDAEELADHLSEARTFVPESLDALRRTIIATRPRIEGRLPRIR